MKYATQTITSYNRSLYCNQNDPLTVISQTGLVAIVETAKGNRFPILIELLSDEMVLVVVEEAQADRKEQLELWG